MLACRCCRRHGRRRTRAPPSSCTGPTAAPAAGGTSWTSPCSAGWPLPKHQSAHVAACGLGLGNGCCAGFTDAGAPSQTQWRQSAREGSLEQTYIVVTLACSLAEAQAYCRFRGAGARVMTEPEYQRLLLPDMHSRYGSCRVERCTNAGRTLRRSTKCCYRMVTTCCC
jgi:hypothetical protein